MYQTHHLYVSDPSKIYIRPINNNIYNIYINNIYVSDRRTICIRPKNYIYQTHQLHIVDRSVLYRSTICINPSTICIRPINYISDPSTIY